MEPNDLATPSSGSVADVAARLALWGRRAPKGLARVEFDSDFSRRDVVADLRQRLDATKVPLHEIELPKFAPAEQGLQFLLERLASLESGVVSITGWSTAFPTEVPLLESLRVLNHNREDLAQFPLCQVWWLTRLFADAFVRDVPDLNSWFIVSLSLTENRTCSVKTEEPSVVSQADAVDPVAALKTSAGLVSRFHQAVNSKAPASALLTLTRPAVVTLHNAGLRQEAQQLAEMLLDETINAAVSQGMLSEKGEIKSDPVSAWERILGHVFNAPAYVGDAALLYDMQGKAVEAEALYTKAFTVAVKTMGENYPLVNFALEGLASLYGAQKRYDEAIALYKHIIQELEKAPKDNNEASISRIVLADRYYDLAETYLAHGNFAEAEKSYHAVLATLRKCLGTKSYQLFWVLQDLSKLYESLGRVDEAELYQQQAAELDAVPAVPQTFAAEASVPG